MQLLLAGEMFPTCGLATPATTPPLAASRAECGHGIEKTCAYHLKSRMSNRQLENVQIGMQIRQTYKESYLYDSMWDRQNRRERCISPYSHDLHIVGCEGCRDGAGEHRWQQDAVRCLH